MGERRHLLATAGLYFIGNSQLRNARIAATIAATAPVLIHREEAASFCRSQSSMWPRATSTWPSVIDAVRPVPECPSDIVVRSERTESTPRLFNSVRTSGGIFSMMLLPKLLPNSIALDGKKRNGVVSPAPFFDDRATP
jgi:hypothetical protein